MDFNNIRRYVLIAVSFLCLCVQPYAQNVSHEATWIERHLDYGVEVFSVFDNTEFAGCKYQNDQTMPMTSLTPELGLKLDDRHHLRVGASVVANWGDDDRILSVSPIAYYEYNSMPFKFLVGAFPKRGNQRVLPRVMMQDSVGYYRPVMTGFLFDVGNDRNYAALWLDWTSFQTTTRRETFFVGWNGQWSPSVFRLRHDGYMFHYAKMKNAPAGQYIHDNMLFVTQAGVDFTRFHSLGCFDEFCLMAGWVVGVEDNRGETSWLIHNAGTLGFKLEWRGLGVSNDLYYGKGQMQFYSQQTNKMYWGDPVYRADFYNRTDLYANVLATPYLKLCVDLAFHTFEQGVYLEQVLSLRMDLNNFGRKVNFEKRKPIFADWFKKE